MMFMVKVYGVIKQTEDDDWRKLDGIPFLVNDYDIITKSLEIAGIQYYIIYIQEENRKG